MEAAIAANAVQGVVAPETCGVGGDMFALIHAPGDSEPTCLNASGRAGSGATALADELRSLGFDHVPQHHPAAVTIPGCVDGWVALHARWGRLALGDVLAPAVALARQGFPASGEFAAALAQRRDELAAEMPSLYSSGRPYLAGERVTRPELGELLAEIAEDGRDAFYLGKRGKALSEAVAGAITPADLERTQAEWVRPLGKRVFGLDAWTTPPNSQGYISLLSLAVLETLGPGDLDDPLRWHLAVESYRVAAATRDHLLADPDLILFEPSQLVSDQQVAKLAALVSPHARARLPQSLPADGGTAYMCAIDATGLGVSLIQSNYHGIGSGIAVGDGGFVLHDRGRGFTLTEGHPNTLAAGRRPAHTLSPTVWTRQGDLVALLGTRGGDLQPQLLAQLAAFMFGHGMSPESAMAHPRWATALPRNHDDPLEVEPGVSDEIVEGLAARGHAVARCPVPMAGWGPMSVITVGSSGLRTGAADPRVDTTMAGCL